VRAALDAAVQRAGLSDNVRETLFSRRRFKQAGARRFRDLDRQATHVC